MHMKSITRLVVAAGVALAVAGCGDLTVEPKSDITSGNIFKDPNSYRSFIAKLYAGLAVTGQSGPAGSADISGIDEGFSQYLRGYWQLQQLPTDETIIGWGDPTLQDVNFQTWSSANLFSGAMYSRIFYQVALANQFLRETSDAKLSERGVSAELKTTIQGYRNEARFLRALSYYHAVDLFGPVPLVDENFGIGALPRQGTRTEVFNFAESELLAIRGALAPRSTGDYYGRASTAAANMILAHLYLNAEEWTGTARYADARAAAEAVIATLGLALDPNHKRIFSLDNTASPEIIFQIPFDGERTMTWGGMTFLIHAAVGDGMNAADYGIDGGWYGLRTRPETVDRFTTGDTRADYLVSNSHTKSIACVEGCSNQGYAVGKFRNKATTGEVGKNLTHPDTDYPMFRLADAYLIYAEAVLRGGGGTRATALGYVNQLRRRAFGGTAGDITDAQLTLPFILDERSRELLWEGYRRQDLIRFGLFSDAGIWQWKGGVQPGKLTESFRDLYPIPASERSANPTVAQNPGY